MTGRCLRHLRIRSGQTVERVAKATGLSAGHIYRLEEKGWKVRLTLQAWDNLSEILGVPLHQLPR